MKYYIYIENRMVAEVEGSEFAWEAYRKTCELADLLGEIASLVDGETGDLLALLATHMRKNRKHL